MNNSVSLGQPLNLVPSSHSRTNSFSKKIPPPQVFKNHKRPPLKVPGARSLSMLKRSVPRPAEDEFNLDISILTQIEPSVKDLPSNNISFLLNSNSVSYINRSMNKPIKRKANDPAEGFSVTLPLDQFIEEYTMNPEQHKTINLPLARFDPISDPYTPRTFLNKLENELGNTNAHSKWFFNDGTYMWKECRILGYDEEKQMFRILWPNGKEKLVSRINLMVPYDRESAFENRIAHAERLRDNAEMVLSLKQQIENMSSTLPDFPLVMIRKIIRLVKGNSKKILLRNIVKNSISDIEVPVLYKFTEIKTWKDERTHLVDETQYSRKLGFRSISELKNYFFKRCKPFVLKYWGFTPIQVTSKKLREMFREIENDFNFTLHRIEFEADIHFNSKKQEEFLEILPTEKFFPPQQRLTVDL